MEHSWRFLTRQSETCCQVKRNIHKSLGPCVRRGWQNIRVALKGGGQREAIGGKRGLNVPDHTRVLNDTLACETAATGSGSGALSATMQIRQENKGFPKSDPGTYP